MAIILVASFCGCDDSSATVDDDNSDPVVIHYSEDGTVNGYRSTTPDDDDVTVYHDESGRLVINSQPSPESGSTPTSGSYCANKNTKKFHTTDCSAGKRSNPENLIYSNNRADLTNKGYQPCKICNP